MSLDAEPTQPPGSPSRRIPEWARLPFRQLFDDCEHLRRIVDLAVRGISTLQGLPGLIEVLAEGEPEDEARYSQRLIEANEQADLARREIHQGFPLLHSWAVVAQWAYLEAFLRHFVAEWLRNRPTAWRVDAVAKLRVRIGEYEATPRQDRHMFVTQLLERELGAGLKNGSTRFEVLLEPFGLSGPLPPELQQTLLEFGQIRNVLAHNAGRIDRRLTDSCPWLGLEHGSTLKVSTTMFHRYSVAAVRYGGHVLSRVSALYGLDVRNHIEDLEAATAQIFSDASPREIDRSDTRSGG